MPGWEAILPETAKALSAPVTKLIEVVAAGFGRVHAPRHVRKMAEAEGDSMIIMELAKERASEVAVRAAHRMLDLETSRQGNLEAVVAKAALELPSEVSAEAVDTDWATRVMQHCQDISDDEMQTLWAKLLAGEVAQPNSFSLRTVQALSQLAKAEAVAFESLCAQAPTIGGQHLPLLFSTDAAELKSAGLQGARALIDLEEAGLLDRSDVGKVWKRPKGTPVVLEFSDRQRLLVLNAKAEEVLDIYEPGHVPAGRYSLTRAGRELAQLVPSNPDTGRAEFLMSIFQTEGMTVTLEWTNGSK